VITERDAAAVRRESRPVERRRLCGAHDRRWDRHVRRPVVVARWHSHPLQECHEPDVDVRERVWRDAYRLRAGPERVVLVWL